MRERALPDVRVTQRTVLRPLVVARHAKYPAAPSTALQSLPAFEKMHISPRTTARVAALAGCAFVALACDVPTGLPIWNTVWQVPADSTEVTVASLLPSSVSIIDAGAGTQAFSFSLPAASTSTTLGEACYACAAAAGQRVPKPEFTLSDSATVQLPVDVVNADIIGGSVDYTLTNGFDFDPLNPGPARGWMRVLVTSGSKVVARDSVDGASLALSSGATINRSMPLLASRTSPVRVDGPVTLVATLFSPAGDTVTVNTSEQFSVTAAAHDITISQVAINVPSTSFNPQHTIVDLSGLDRANGKITGGAVILSITNPFAVGGSLSLDFSAPNGARVTKAFALAVGGTGSAPSTIRIPLTATEINSLVGQKNVAITVSGTVSSPSGAVTVTPMERMALKALVEATIVTGGN